MSAIRHKLLHISSKDKQQGTNEDFSLNLSNHYWLQSVKGVIVKQITVTNVFYNVDSTNYSFTYEIAGVPSTVTVAAGQYTITQLLSALDTAMVADGVVGFSSSLNAITQRVDFSSTTAIEYLYAGNDMAEILGITTGNGSDVTSFSAQAAPKLDGVTNLAIASNTLGENNYLSSDQKIQDVIAIVPVTGPYGDVIHYQSQEAELDSWDALSFRQGKNISQIDVRVFDKDKNTLVDLTNHDIDILLKVYY